MSAVSWKKTPRIPPETPCPEASDQAIRFVSIQHRVLSTTNTMEFRHIKARKVYVPSPPNATYLYDYSCTSADLLDRYTILYNYIYNIVQFYS